MIDSLAWLGLDTQASERDIKRAYAKRLKAIRPDEDPAGFQALYDHYQQALAWRARQVAAHAELSVSSATSSHDIEDEDQDDTAQQTATPETAEHRVVIPRAAPPAAGRESPPNTNQHRVVIPRATPPAAGRESPPITLPRIVPPAAHKPAEPSSRARGPAYVLPPFDAAGFISSYIPQARKLDDEQLTRWLNGDESLWHLQHKQQAGQALLRELFARPQPISAANFDATLDFFDLEQWRAGVDPGQVGRLRSHMDERHQLALAYPVHRLPWGLTAETFDVHAFLAWLYEQAPSLDSRMLAAFIYEQPALDALALRQSAALVLWARTVQDLPPWSADTTQFLLQYFPVPRTSTKLIEQLSDLPATLHVRWLMLPERRIELAVRLGDGDMACRPGTANRWLSKASYPFSWRRSLVIASTPGLPKQLGLFFWRLSGGQPQRLDGAFDPRAVRFWIGAATRQHVTAQRWTLAVYHSVIALFLTMLAGFALQALSDPPVEPWLPLHIAAWCAGLGLAYLTWKTLFEWQCQPETEPVPWPRLCMMFIPLMCLLSGVCFVIGASLATDDRVWAGITACQPLLFPVTVLARLRYRWRNLPQASHNFMGNGSDQRIALGVALPSVALVPPLCLVIALGYWTTDLIKQRKQLRWRKHTDELAGQGSA